MGCACSNEIQAQGTDLLTDTEFEKFLKCFHHPEKYYDIWDVYPTLSSLESVNAKFDPQFQLLLCYYTDAQNHTDEFLDYWTQKQNDFNHPNLLMVHTISVTYITSLIVPLKKIAMLLDKPHIVLGHHPQLLADEPFKEEQIWFLLDCLVAALAYEQTQKVRCSNLTLNDIYVIRTQFGLDVYKLSDCFCKPFEERGYQYLVESMRDLKHMREIQRQILLSPKQMEFLQLKLKYPMQNVYKTQVFILGVLVLHTLDLFENQEIYDWDAYQIRSKVLENRLADLLKKKYELIQIQKSIIVAALNTGEDVSH